MKYRLNASIQATSTPPIAEVQGWVQNRDFSADKPLIDVSQAVPSYGPPDSLIGWLAEQLRDDETALYTDILGLTELRAEFADHLNQDYGARLTMGQVAITAGCNQAFCLAIDALAEPKSEVVLVLPYYFNHLLWLQMRDVTAQLTPFKPNEAELLEGIEAKISSATRAIALVTPNNPTGIQYSPRFLDSVFDLAQSHGAALILDETYKDFRDGPEPPHALNQRPNWDETLIQLFSFSKSFAMTGYRVGAMTAHPAMLAQIEKIIDNVTICPSHPGQLAALFGLRSLSSWRAEKARLLQDRVKQLQHCFDDTRLDYELVSSGAYFAYVRHPFEGHSALDVARRLADEFNVLCLPGPVFGPGQECFMRFAFANLEADFIPELTNRLIDSQSRSAHNKNV